MPSGMSLFLLTLPKSCTCSPAVEALALISVDDSYPRKSQVEGRRPGPSTSRMATAATNGAKVRRLPALPACGRQAVDRRRNESQGRLGKAAILAYLAQWLALHGYRALGAKAPIGARQVTPAFRPGREDVETCKVLGSGTLRRAIEPWLRSPVWRMGSPPRADRPCTVSKNSPAMAGYRAPAPSVFTQVASEGSFGQSPPSAQLQRC